MTRPDQHLDALLGRDENLVLSTCIAAMRCARSDGAPFDAEDERRMREYFARVRRLRATLLVAMWIAGTPWGST